MGFRFWLVSILAHGLVCSLLVVIVVQDRNPAAEISIHLKSTPKLGAQTTATPNSSESPKNSSSTSKSLGALPQNLDSDSPQKDVSATGPDTSPSSGPVVRLIAFDKPGYPRSLKKQGIEGVVKLQAQIMNDGCVETVRIVESSGYEAFDAAAKNALAAARFSVDSTHESNGPWVFDLAVRFALQ